MSEAQFFGYGSLVNRGTHAFAYARPARLSGWRRRWVSTSLRPVAYLSVEPWDGEIAGLVARVPGADWTALDEREAAYDKHPVNVRLHACGTETKARVYVVSPGHTAPPDTAHPVLLSYIDTVVQGFLEEFGTAGARAFFETTTGWHFPILNDRRAPRYPRATRLSTGERAFVDAALAAVVE
ncbi:MAG: gamma-glutamylcyclotransferase family protein [Pseudomonadota bacterium]